VEYPYLATIPSCYKLVLTQYSVDGCILKLGFARSLALKSSETGEKIMGDMYLSTYK
jgi:hypothetical protein